MLLEKHRKTIETRSGTVSYLDVGAGPVALFMHGVATNAYLWRKVIAAFGPEIERGERRLVAVDMIGHGHTPTRPGAALSLTALADYLEDFCAAAELSAIDLVANDTGGAIAQVFAVHHPERLATFTLTNCDTEDNLPPFAFVPIVKLASSGLLARLGPRLAKFPSFILKTIFASAYQHPGRVPQEILRGYLQPVLGTKENAFEFQRLLNSVHNDELRAIRPALNKFTVPTLLVWATGDLFFRIKWGRRLRDTIPGVTELIEVPGGMLFFPDERPEELAGPLRKHWAAHREQIATS